MGGTIPVISNSNCREDIEIFWINCVFVIRFDNIVKKMETVKLCELHRQDAKVKFDYFFFCLLLASSSDLFFLFFIFHLLDKGENEAVGYNHSPLVLSYPSCIEIDRLGVIATKIFEQMENQL